MPQFGAANEHASWPSWATPTIRQRIGRHPHPATNRVDGRLCWPSDSLHRSLATRQWGQLRWDTQQPPGDPPEYANWENVWWDWRAIGPREVYATIGVTTSGRSAIIRLRHYDAMPIMGIPGTELYYEGFVGDVSIGIRTIEYPDDTDAWEYNSANSLAGPIAGTTTPAPTAPLGLGQWFWIDSNAISECWRWWNTHRVTTCPYESDPNGMASMAVKMEGWGWGQNKFSALGEDTEVQKLFAAKVNGRHICTPTWHPSAGWLPCQVQYQSPVMYDPDYVSILAHPGAYYGFSYQIGFNDGSWAVFLHIRVWEFNRADPNWEVWTSRGLSSGIFTLFGVNGRLMNAAQQMPAPPYASRSASQYDFQATMFNVPAFGPFGLNDCDEGICIVEETTAEERGLEPPLEGPLDMTSLTKDTLVFRPQTTQAIQGNPRMAFAGAQYNSAGFWQPGSFTDRLVIPAGVKKVEGYCAFDASSASEALSCHIKVDGSSDPGQSIFQEPDGGATARRGIALLAPTDVSENDTVSVFVNSSAGHLTASHTRNWLYLRRVSPDIELIANSLVAHDVGIPAASTELWIVTIPPALNDFEVTHLGLTYGSNKSPAGTLQVKIAWMRAASRMFEDVTDDPIQIDADHWSSATSLSPYSIHPAGALGKAGDIMVASIQQVAAGATGLIFEAELSGP